MHSWYRSLLLPAAGITVSFGSSTDSSTQRERRRSSPITVRSQKDLRNGKIHDAREGVKWTAGCNPLRSAACTHNSTQVVPYGGEEETADASSSLSATKDGATLSANVSSTQLEELVMKEGSDPNAPLVILFGWAGCRDRYLQKYASYYQNEGFSVARFTVPISKIRSFSSYRKFALEIYEKILEQEPNRPIFFHMFSMNGCSLFTALWDLLDNVADGPEIKKRVHGLIFDSSPANVLPWQAANAISMAMFPRSGAFPREAYRVALAGIFSLHRAMVWLQSNFNEDTYQKHYAYFKLQQFNDLPLNQLYLYSDADDICVRESIEQFQETQHSRQANIHRQCWADSDHCQHFRRYMDEYTRACLEFTRKSLNRVAS